jgi:SOS-response transcriptional repressor LexA
MTRQKLCSVIPFPTARESLPETLLKSRNTKLVSAHELLDFNSHTLIVHLRGHSLTKFGLEDGDTIVADSSIRPTSGDFVVTLSGDEKLLQPVYFSEDSLFLFKSNQRLVRVERSDIKAVATHVIRRLRHQTK